MTRFLRHRRSASRSRCVEFEHDLRGLTVQVNATVSLSVEEWGRDIHVEDLVVSVPDTDEVLTLTPVEDAAVVDACVQAASDDEQDDAPDYDEDR